MDNGKFRKICGKKRHHVRSINGALGTKVDEDVINEAGSDPPAEGAENG